MVATMKKAVSEDIISTEINGNVYEGKRIITGTIVKYQTIYYLDVKDFDSTMYKKDRQHLMDGKADIILSQLVKRYHNL